MATVIKPGDRRFAKVLIFAPPGNGKTYFLGTAQADERTAPMLLLDFEGGHETLAGLDIDVVEIRGWDDYNEVFEVLESGEHWTMEGSSLAEGETYKSLGIDSVSETHVWALLQILDAKGESRKEPDLIQLDDYNVGTTQMRRLLREFRDLPMHVFYTAHAKVEEERGIGKVQLPKMSGQMANEIVGLMSICGYLAISEDEETGDEQRELLLQNYVGFRIKARVPWETEIPDEIVNPTVTSLLDACEFTDTPAPKRRRTKKTPKEDTDE